MTKSLYPPIEKKPQIQTDNQKEPFCFCLVVLIYFEKEETAKAISNSFFSLKMLKYVQSRSC